MKKRIIRLILVVAMAFLTLTGCGYSYAKDDMTKYATFSAEEFFKALTEGDGLFVTDGAFGTDDEGRAVKIKEAIAAAILGVTTDKKFDGKVGEYDKLYYVYYATDDMGNMFYASSMNEGASKLPELQLGLSTLKDLDKAISDRLLATDASLSIEDIAKYIYSTSAANVVNESDVVSVSYTKTWKDSDGKEQTETVSNYYYPVVTIGEKNSSKEFAKQLVGKQVGVDLGSFTVTETETVGTGDNQVTNEVEYTYTDVKVESIVKDNSTQTVKAGDIVNVTYTYTFDASAWYNKDTGEYDFGSEISKLGKVDKDGKYSITYTNTFVTTKEDVKNSEGKVDDANKTFEGQLVGKGIGTTSSISLKDQTLDGKTVDINYTGVKVNWIVNSDMNSIDVKYTPYAQEELKEGEKEPTLTNTIGQAVEVRNKELTYHIFPVYYLDVVELTAEMVVRDFYTTITATEAHDEAEEEGEHEEGEEHAHKNIFSILDGNYKYTVTDENGKETVTTLKTLVEELTTLYSTLSSKKSTLSSKLSSLTTAQQNLAKDKGDVTATTDKLVNDKDKAYTDYKSAKKEVDDAQKAVDDKIEEILACKDGETSVKEGLVEGYKNYTAYNLEQEYKSELDKNVVKAIISYLKANIKFTGELPKKAVDEAYDSIMNAYKYDFYEGKYNSTTTNYKQYKGNFDEYLKAVTKTSNVKSAKAAMRTAAEESVKEVIIIYVLTAAVEERWSNAEILLTKEEIKNIKKNIEAQEVAYKNYESLYEQIGYKYSDVVPSYSDAYHSSQFDKAINFLIKRDKDNGNEVVYKNIKYHTEVETEVD